MSQPIKAVQAGEEVVIANRGEPVARLVRADQHNGRGIATGRAGWDWAAPVEPVETTLG